MKNRMSESLKAEVESRINALANEEKYLEEYFSWLNGSVVKSVEETGQMGVTVPRHYGAINTFVTNPSNVGIGILARMIETDDTVQAAVMFKSLMMLSKIGDYYHENESVQEFVRDFLDNMKGPTWIQSLEAMSSYYPYGFSVSEIIWGLENKEKKIPKKVVTYHPSTIVFEVDSYGSVTDDGVIQFVVQHSQVSNPNTYFPYYQYGFKVKNPFETPDDRLLPYRIPFLNNYGMVRIPKNKVIHHTNNEILSFGSPYGKSPVRTAHLAWQMKTYFMKQMGVAGKRQASPFVWGTAPFNQNKVETKNPDGSVTRLNPVEALTALLAQRENDDAIVTGPEDMGYKLQEIAATIDLGQYTDVINQLNTYIFRAFLLPSLVMTDGQSGSRSLGDKHFQIVDFMSEQDAKKFTATIVDQMIRPAIEANFGKQKNYGEFKSRPQTIEERERLSTMFSSLASAGWMRSHDKKDGDFVRSSLHLPAQDESFYTIPMPPVPEIDPEDKNKEGDEQ